MESRKIQLIAGTTYSVSLPKYWVKKNNLKEKGEVHITEQTDGSLSVAPPREIVSDPDGFFLNVDEHTSNIEEVLFAIYYRGFEKITLFSKSKIERMMRLRIKKSMSSMSGTEIMYEDSKRIKIKSLLDKKRVEVKQLFFRMCILINSSISNILEGANLEEIKINEDEIDRLYHLVSKMIHISLSDYNIRQSSGLINLSVVPSYFLINKRLENMGDMVYDFARHIINNDKKIKKERIILEYVKKELKQRVNFFMKKKTEDYSGDKESIVKMRNYASNVEDKIIARHMDRIVRYLADIEEALITLAFYRNMKD